MRCSARGAAYRIAPRWARSAPKSRSTSRASGSSRCSPTSPRARLHRPLPHRLPPDPDRVGRRRRRRPLPGRGAAALGLDGHDDRRAGGALPDRRARPGRARQPHPQPHGLGADRGAGLADRGAVLALDRAGARSTAGWSCSAPARSGRSGGWREALRGCATGSSRARRTASGSPSPGATATRPASPRIRLP